MKSNMRGHNLKHRCAQDSRARERNQARSPGHAMGRPAGGMTVARRDTMAPSEAQCLWGHADDVRQSQKQRVDTPAAQGTPCTECTPRRALPQRSPPNKASPRDADRTDRCEIVRTTTQGDTAGARSSSLFIVQEKPCNCGRAIAKICYSSTSLAIK